MAALNICETRHTCSYSALINSLLHTKIFYVLTFTLIGYKIFLNKIIWIHFILCAPYICTGSAKFFFFFFENVFKNTTEYFLKFLLLFESTIPPVNSGK